MNLKIGQEIIKAEIRYERVGKKSTQTEQEGTISKSFLWCQHYSENKIRQRNHEKKITIDNYPSQMQKFSTINHNRDLFQEYKLIQH